MSKQNREAVARLEEIREEIKALNEEALMLVRSAGAHEERARVYWYAHIQQAVDSDHEWLGGSMCTMEESANEIDTEPTLDEIREDRLALRAEQCPAGTNLKDWM